MARIGIIGAMEEEVTYLKSIAEEKTERDGFVSGKIGGKDVVVVMSGIGKVNAAASTQLAIATLGRGSSGSSGRRTSSTRGLRARLARGWRCWTWWRPRTRSTTTST